MTRPEFQKKGKGMERNRKKKNWKIRRRPGQHLDPFVKRRKGKKNKRGQRRQGKKNSERHLHQASDPSNLKGGKEGLSERRGKGTGALEEEVK